MAIIDSIQVEMQVGYTSINQIKRDIDHQALKGFFAALIYSSSHEVKKI